MPIAWGEAGEGDVLAELLVWGSETVRGGVPLLTPRLTTYGRDQYRGLSVFTFQ